jgi:membrane-associated protein
MFSSILHLLWNPPEAYLILFALAALDAVFPVVPSETGLILAGILCVVGPHLSLSWVLAAAALGAFAGDNTSYALGRFVGRPVQRRFFGGERGRKALDWARSQLDKRGGLLVVVGRFIPGGRTATTFTCGLTHFPWLRFAAFEAVAAVSWSLYGGLLGYFGGRMFHDQPWLALVVAFGIAGGITVAVEGLRRLRTRS